MHRDYDFGLNLLNYFHGFLTINCILSAHRNKEDVDVANGFDLLVCQPGLAKIAKMPDGKQEQAISEPAAVKTPKPKRAMYDAAKVPVDALRAAALKAGERGSGPITDWLKSIGVTSDAG